MQYNLLDPVTEIRLDHNLLYASTTHLAKYIHP